MRIYLTNGAKTYYLTGQPGVSERVHSSAFDYQKRSQAVTQTAGFVRGKAVKVYDRGNVQTTISFGTTRKFATAADAVAWAHDHEADYPRTGTVIVETDRANLGAIRRYLREAVVSPPDIEFIGATLVIRYSITGGIFSKS